MALAITLDESDINYMMRRYPNITDQEFIDLCENLKGKLGEDGYDQSELNSIRDDVNEVKNNLREMITNLECIEGSIDALKSL